MADQSFDVLMSHRIGLERYKAHLIGDLIPYIDDAEKDVLREIQLKASGLMMSNPSDRKRLDDLLQTIRKIQTEAHVAMRSTFFDDNLSKLPRQEAIWAKDYYADYFGLSGSLKMPSATTLMAAAFEKPMSGRLLSSWYDRLGQQTMDEAERIVRLGIIEGLSVPQIINRLGPSTVTKATGTDGNAPFSNYQGAFKSWKISAAALTRTAVNHVSNAAHARFIIGNRDVFDRYQWVSVLDSRTSKMCRQRNGAIYEVDRGPVPPGHVNCRATIRGLPKGAEPAHLPTYEEWLKDQPKEVQVDILGTKRAALLADNKLPVDGFVDYQGKRIPLAELPIAERAAWDKAKYGPDLQNSIEISRRLYAAARDAGANENQGALLSRMWDFLRWKSDAHLEAGLPYNTMGFGKNGDLYFWMNALDFFSGPTVISYGKYYNRSWRFAAGGIHARRGTFHIPSRPVRGLTVHPPFRPRPRDYIPGDDLPHPFPPPIGPDSIIIPPGKRTPDIIPERPPPFRTPHPTERLPAIGTTKPVDGEPGRINGPHLAKNGKPIEGEIIPPRPHDGTLPRQPGKIIDLDPGSYRDVPPVAPRRLTVKDIESELGPILRDKKLTPDEKIDKIWGSLTKGGKHDGLIVQDQDGKDRYVINVDPNQRARFLEEWSLRTAEPEILPPIRPGSVGSGARDVIIDGEVLTPQQIAERNELTRRLNAQRVLQITRQVTQPALDDAIVLRKETAELSPEEMRLRFEARVREKLAKLAARDDAEAKRRLDEHQKWMDGLLGDLDRMNEVLHGREGGDKFLLARTRQLQEIIRRTTVTALRPEGEPVYKPIRWGDYAYLGDTPASLQGKVMEIPGFTSGTLNRNVAIQAGARNGDGPLVLMRMRLNNGDSAIVGHGAAGEVVRPADSFINVKDVRPINVKQLDAETRAHVERLYGKKAEIWIADAEFVETGSERHRKIADFMAEQSTFITAINRMPLDATSSHDMIRMVQNLPFDSTSSRILIDKLRSIDPATITAAKLRDELLALPLPADYKIMLKDYVQQMDGAALDALRKTPYAPFKRVDGLTGVRFNKETGEIEVGRERMAVHERVNPSFRTETPIAPNDPGHEHHIRRAVGESINRSGVERPLSNAVSDDLAGFGDAAMKRHAPSRIKGLDDDPAETFAKIAKGKSLEALETQLRELGLDVRWMNDGRTRPAHPTDPGKYFDDARYQHLLGHDRVAAEQALKLARQMDDAHIALADAIARKDPIAFAKISEYVSTYQGRNWGWGYFRDELGLHPNQADARAKDVKASLRAFSELTQALTVGRAQIDLDATPLVRRMDWFGKARLIDAERLTFKTKDEAAERAFAAWFQIEYGNPHVRQIMDHMYPGLREQMRAVLSARAKFDTPDVYSPYVRVSRNGRIVSRFGAIEGPEPIVAVRKERTVDGVPEADWHRVFDYVYDGKGGLSLKDRRALAKDLGLSQEQIDLVFRRLHKKGAVQFVEPDGKAGYYMRKPEALRPSREAVLSPGTQIREDQRRAFYDMVHGVTRNEVGELSPLTRFASLSDRELKRWQGDMGLTDNQMSRLVREAQALDHLQRDTNGALYRPWNKGKSLERKGEPPPRPTEADIAKLRGKLGDNNEDVETLESVNVTRDTDEGSRLRQMARQVRAVIRGEPNDVPHLLELPERSLGEQELKRKVWAGAKLDADTIRALQSTEPIVISSKSSDKAAPMAYDASTGVIHTGGRDIADPGEQGRVRSEVAHHLDLPMTPDGTVRQYSAAPEHGFAKSMTSDAKALVTAHDPNMKLEMPAEVALAMFRDQYGIDLTHFGSTQAAHKVAEFAVRGNPAFVGAFEELRASKSIVRLKSDYERAVTSEFEAFSDMIGSVTRLKMGGGHSAEYYAKQSFDIGAGFTNKHAAEAWAQWFQLNTSERTGWRKLMDRYLSGTSDSARRLLKTISADTE